MSAENTPEQAQNISNQVRDWWHNQTNSNLSEAEISQLIQELSGPPAVWYSIPKEHPYNSMEAWCEGELNCDPDTFLGQLQSFIGEEAISQLRDRRLSAIFRPLPD